MGQYFPLSLNALLLAVAAYWCYRQLDGVSFKKDAPSSFGPLLILMGKTAFWFLMVLVAFSLLSVLVCYLHFLWHKRRQDETMNFEFSHQEKRGWMGFKAILKSVWRPWLGTVSCRLLYDDGRLTDKLPLLGNQKEKRWFFRDAIYGKQALVLPDIKEYDLEGGFIYFEDFLHLFSFSCFLPKKGHFYQPPKAGTTGILEAQPREVRRDNIRVEESQRMPGDYVLYKDFEGGDDIRRIVWQVYAKSRDLMVRMPEERDFFASDINFYASFYAGGIPEIQSHNAFGAEMLNFYKNCTWTAIDTLLKKNISIKYVPDQPFQADEALSPADRIRHHISNATWQKGRPLTDYFPARKQGILCLSSFAEPEDLKALLEIAGAQVIVYFVPLSATFRQLVAWTWLKRIFVKTPADRLKRIRGRWLFSSLHAKTKRREKALIKLLEAYEVRWAILK
ncbi:MAG TPA: DUF58 domain-containing protein [Edaphocola sp.]|nr:DUF58 domain-containing protein [Edaphocola sp.]